jgi:hypothetical protein
MLSPPVMKAKGLTPILNVSDIAGTVAWFEKWGQKKLWDWGTPPGVAPLGRARKPASFFVRAGGRGRGANTTTFQQDRDEEGDKGAGMSIWVDGLEITFPPTNMPWNVREMHHPDGHVFRVSRGFNPGSSILSR